MPIEVDVAARMQDIADATIAVSESRGVEGVTIRAVAERMGGSTTMITNYLPTRSALLRNAIDHAIAGWRRDADEALDGAEAEERFRELALWSCTTTGDDQVLRQLLIELLAASAGDTEPARAVRKDAHDHHEQLLVEARKARVPDPAFAADVVHLALRGFYMSTLEDPQRWTSEYVTPIFERLLGLLGTPPAPPSSED